MEAATKLSEAFVIVSGNIGAGKSTLVRRLAEAVGSRAVLERHAENPYLGPFYEEPARWGFHVQAGFLSLALDDYRSIADGGGRGILERTLEEHHEVFAAELRESGHLSEPEFQILARLHGRAAAAAGAEPDLLIHLRAPAEELLDRVRMRERKSEVDLSLDYLSALNRRYDEFIANWAGCPVVDVDTLELDIRRDRDRDAVASRCAAALGRVKR